MFAAIYKGLKDNFNPNWPIWKMVLYWMLGPPFYLAMVLTVVVMLYVIGKYNKLTRISSF